MAEQDGVGITVRITSLSVHYKQPSIAYMTPAPVEESRPEIDTNYVNIGFSFLENKHLGDSGSCLTIKTVDAKRLGLMVGDVLTIRIDKDSQKQE